MWMDIQSVDCNIIFTVLYNTYVDGSLLLDVFPLLGSHHMSQGAGFMVSDFIEEHDGCLRLIQEQMVQFTRIPRGKS